MSALLHGLSLAPWLLLWAVGGLWLARAAFRLERGEGFSVGLLTGLVVENILANLLARVLPTQVAFWLAAALTLLAGLAFAYRSGVRLLRLRPAPWGQLALALGLTYVFFIIGRGLAIFDDYAHLPVVSMMAAGDIPPHFSLNPAIPYGYHYFIMLFAAQMMRIGRLLVWDSFDLARGLTFALAILLAVAWTRRITRSTVAGWLGALVLAFGSGTRWLLLLLPGRVVNYLSQGVQMLGSGAGSGSTLASALTSPWAVEGSGPLPFPFAFANGIYTPGVLSLLSPNGLAGPALLLTLLLTYRRWSGWRGAALSAFYIAALGLLAEIEMGLILAGWGIIILAVLITRRKLSLPANLRRWLIPLVAGGLLAVLQGGTWTDMLSGLLARFSGSALESYQTIGFGLDWPPALVSSHLGVLSLISPRQLPLALLETGPVLLVLPLVAIWGWKAFRSERWFEAVLALAGVATLGSIVVRFTGSTGVRNTPRLYEFLAVGALFFLPLFWIWAQRRAAWVRGLVWAMLGVLISGGIVLFGVELVAIQRPVYSYFITSADKQMAEKYWNRLPVGALIFDPTPSRAPVVFGRPTRSSLTWYQTLPEWEQLVAKPTVSSLRAAGFDYVYLDRAYWDGLTPELQASLQTACVKQLDEFAAPENSYRRLLDIHQCPSVGQ